MEGEEKVSDVETVLQKRNVTVTNFVLAGGESEEGLELLSTDGSLTTINLYDRAGKLTKQLVGIIDQDELERNIQSLLEQG